MQLAAVGIADTIILQQDGALYILLSEFENTLMNCFQTSGLGEIRGSTGPLAWPPRSPNLFIPDNALWGFIKDKVSQ